MALATSDSKQIIANLKSIAQEFQGACSVKAVEMCERKLEAQFTSAQQEIKRIFHSVKHSSVQSLDRAITSCNRCTLFRCMILRMRFQCRPAVVEMMHPASRLHVWQPTDGWEQTGTAALPYMTRSAHIISGTVVVFF